MLKVIAACGNGLGSSQIIRLKLEKVFRKLGIDAEIRHMNVEDAKGKANDCDVLFCSEFLKDSFAHSRAKVIGLRNLLSENEMTEKTKAALIDQA